jgi:hypothetical protein
MDELYLDSSKSMNDATEIESIVSNIGNEMQDLDSAIRNNIPDSEGEARGVNTQWSREARALWKKYEETDIAQTMEEMLDSAKNLKMAVDNALQINQGQN